MIGGPEMEKTSLIFCELNIFCILILVMLLRRVLSSSNKSGRNRISVVMLLMHMCVYITNTLGEVFAIDIVGAEIAVLFSQAFYIFLSLATCSWAVYLFYCQDPDWTWTRRGQLILTSPFLVDIICNLLTPWLHLFYWAEGDRVNSSRDWIHIVLMFGVQFIYAGIALWRNQMESDYVQRRLIRVVAIYPVFPAILALVSLFIRGLPSISIANLVAILEIYLSRQELQVSIDPLTKVNNRTHLADYISRKIAEHEDSLYLMVLDLDDFKLINDRYGHLEGDRALAYVAAVLKSACSVMPGRPFIARYGGDEFIIVADGIEEVQIERLRSNIEHRVSVYPGTEHGLSVSIGLQRFDHSIRDQKHFISLADEKMYTEKQAKKSTRRTQKAES